MIRQVALLAVAGCSLAACSTSEVLVAHTVALDSSATVVPENQLLDVAVRVLDPGVPDGELSTAVKEQLVQEGIFAQIRRTEAIYMAVELRDTLRSSGHWGAIWVTPDDSASNVADITINAAILQSDGEEIRLDVQAVDATGRKWIDDTYEATIAASAYNRSRFNGLDPYQDVFNSIANDLAEARLAMSDKDVDNLREVSALRYAADLSPDAFDGYLVEQRDGTVKLNRLPAADDPQFDRTQRARQRERLFFDTLDQHYETFSNEAVDTYDSWRQDAREEAIEVREITRSRRLQMGLGAASIAASLLYGSNSSQNNLSNRVARDAMMYIGFESLQLSAQRRQEKLLHTDMLQELSASFDNSVKPLVVDVLGTEHRLTGTAEVQYQEWRDLLRELYRSETGFEPQDFDIYIEEPPQSEAPADEEVAPESTNAGDAKPTEASSSAGGSDSAGA